AGPEAVPAGFDARLAEAGKAVLARQPARSVFVPWLRVASLLLAAGFLVVVLGGLFQTRPWSARLDFTEGAIVRGAPTRTCHLVLSLPEATHLWILRRDADGHVRQLLPNENPVLAQVEGEAPWPAGASVRVPRDPLLDFAADWGPQGTTLFVVPTS